MPTPFGHPSGQKLLGSISDIFRTKRIFQRKDRHIVFVCGGPVKPRSRSMRYRFLKYAWINLQQYRFFLAEAATKDLTQHGEPEFINLADFESLIAAIADCIVLFLESPGSIGELGFFANSETAVKKLLVANDVDKQKDSFINVGLLDIVNTKSEFKSVIWLNQSNPDFNLIKERLLSRLSARSGKRFEFKKFAQFTPEQQLYVVFQTIYIFKVMTYESIVHCIEEIFENVRERRIRHLLSVLVAIQYVERRGEDLEYFIPAKEAEPFLDFRNYDIRDIQTTAASFYKDYHRETYKLLTEVAS